MSDLHPIALLQLLLLLTVANGMPVIAKKLLGRLLAWPLDFGMTMRDGRPLFGASKTVRGLVLAIVVTAAAAPVLGLAWQIGAAMAARRWPATSCRASPSAGSPWRRAAARPGWTRYPEALLPALASMTPLGLGAADVVLVIALFVAGEIALSRLLYHLHVRDEPY